MTLYRLVAPLFALALFAAPAAAQSADDLLKLFDKQKQLLTVPDDGSLGVTRGITVTTYEDLVAEDADPGGVSVSGDAQASDPNLIQAASDPNAPLSYSRLAPELQVNLNITFGFDSATLDRTEAPKLDLMCEVLKRSGSDRYRIIGHTDSSGDSAYNDRLSMLRAKEVARHLITECGIDPARLQTVGVGEREPLNADDTRADENRRVEFQVLI